MNRHVAGQKTGYVKIKRSLSDPLSLTPALLDDLAIAIKHEGIDLVTIKELFLHLDARNIVEYVQAQPTGIYSRKIWFLYEFLMDVSLPLNDCQRVKYVDLLDSKLYFTCTPIKSSRHAINNNLLGNRHFCPTVRRTNNITQSIDLNLEDEAQRFLNRYDLSLITRASHYLYTKEIMSSYQIERETPDKNRIARFINLLQKAPLIDVMSKAKLIELQNEIVDARFIDEDYRNSQNYVGENLSYDYQKIHYISPKPQDVPELMQGLLQALERMMLSNVHPVIIASTISFGFVFIHPFEDGNGRLHRFLIHYVLSKTGFTPKNMIFPVSSVILKNSHEYDQALESYSQPLLQVIGDYDLTDDGKLTVNKNTNMYYQYIDFTYLTEYLFNCINDAIHTQMEKEIKFLVSYDTAKKQIQHIIDMPDKQIDLIIKLVIQNNGQLSDQKRKNFFDLLTDTEISNIVKAINDAYHTL